MLKKFASLADPQDRFLLFFGGLSLKDDRGETYIIPYPDPERSFPDIFKNRQEIRRIPALISLAELSAWLEPLPCETQLFVSEAGSGSDFAQNLMYHLFEQNPYIASATNRNRIILTTKGYGADNLICQGKSEQMGPLMFALTRQNNLKELLFNPGLSYCKLSNSLLPCGSDWSDYIAVFEEAHYWRLLTTMQQKSGLRGGKSKATLESGKEESGLPKTYVLLVGTDEYQAQTDWNNLTNPFRDALAVKNVLDRKFGAECSLLQNCDKDSFLIRLIEIKERIRS